MTTCGACSGRRTSRTGDALVRQSRVPHNGMVRIRIGALSDEVHRARAERPGPRIRGARAGIVGVLDSFDP
jgi:hypothetical protein